MPAKARIHQALSQSQLVQKADLVVIATIRFTTADDTGPGPSPATTTGYGTPVKSEFDVLTVVKGKLDGKILAVRHERLSDHLGFGVINGPIFVRFDLKDRNEYLIYLKKVGDGYEPLSGQTDPEESFYRLCPYSEPTP
jgi:hypothetical protein